MMLQILAQQSSDSEAAAGAAAALGSCCCIGVFYLALIALVVAGVWKVFTKAGKPGWAAIVPIYNIIVLLEITGKPIWWIVLYFVPVANIVVAIMVVVELAKRFGKGIGFVLGMIFLPMIFYPILGFGKAQYIGGPTPPQTV